MYWQNNIESCSRNKLEQHQLELLKTTLKQSIKAPFYKKQLGGNGFSPDSLTSPDDIFDLPFTTKEDLRENFPYGFLAKDKQELIRLHSSSGTTGNPTVVYHSRNDINAWSDLMARSLYCAGIRNTDVFQNICGYGLFTGGLGFQYGSERLGCLTIPAGAGNSLRQIKLMMDYGTTVAHAIPSYLNRLYDVFAAQGLDPKEHTKLHTLVIGAEPHTEEQRMRIEKQFGVKAYNSYGLSEMNGPGVAFECTFQNGMHIWEDAFIVEIVDPNNLKPVLDGEYGELVMTTLQREAMPLIRYRTRDLTRFIPGKCECGRVHRRIDRIIGRSDDMFIVKGCNVFPMQIEKVLLRFKELAPEYRITLERINDNDELRVDVELSKENFNGDIKALGNLTNKIIHDIRDEILVKLGLSLLEPGSIPRSEGKAVRVYDKRFEKIHL